MKKLMLMTSFALMLIASPVAAQIGAGSGRGAGTGVAGDDEQATSSSSSSSQTTTKDGRTTTTVKTDETRASYPWVRTLTNVQIELTLTDQLGNLPPEKKIVSMIASSGNWGKVRSGSMFMPPGEAPYSVVLNVDARPYVSVDGPIQLEMTLVYEPVKGEGDANRRRPSGINQSQTIVLQSGKPLVVSQAADPQTDRKVIVEIKATVLK